MRKQYSGIFRQWIGELAALPVSYFCNYCLLAAAGIAFEYAVFLMRYGNWLPAYGTQSLIVASVQVTILQTAAEYFRAEGPAGFALRLTAAAAHFAFFTALILLQLDVRIPTGQFCAMLGVLFWIVAINETRFRGKGRLILLPLLIFGIMLVRPFLEDAAEDQKISGRMLAAANAVLFLILYRTWTVCRGKNVRSGEAAK